MLKYTTLALAAGFALSAAAVAVPQKAQAGGSVHLSVPGFSLHVGPRYRYYDPYYYSYYPRYHYKKRYYKRYGKRHYKRYGKRHYKRYGYRHGYYRW